MNEKHVTKTHLSISELFYSLQGESTRAGLPCAFIRLAGCNLRCRYCDSKYTWENQGEPRTLTEIGNWLDRYPGVMVELTGGEPLLQEGIYPLLDALLDRGRTVLLETNGSLGIEQVPAGVSVILDIKCPDSGMHERTDWQNIALLAARKRKGSGDEIKFVLSSVRDFEWAKAVIDRYQLDRLAVPLLFSPVPELLAATTLAGLILQHRLPVRLQLQLHRLLWPDRDRGV